jgi:hypothetical protein
LVLDLDDRERVAERIQRVLERCDAADAGRTVDFQPRDLARGRVAHAPQRSADVDHRVVQAHECRVRRHANVELAAARAIRERAQERKRRVLRRPRAGAAVPEDDHPATSVACAESIR